MIPQCAQIPLRKRIQPRRMRSSITRRFISKLCLASSSSRSSPASSARVIPRNRWPSRAQLIVTTPTEPVCSAEPNSPLPRLSSSRKSSCNRQHIERTMSGLQLGVDEILEIRQPVFRRHLKQRLGVRMSQSKSFVMLYVGIGNVNSRPLVSPALITSINARLIKSISACSSP